MADKKKFPNPEFFRAKTEMDWKAQAANLKEFGSIALDLIKETDWKAFGRKQKEHFLDNMNRVAREAKTVAAMTCAERKDLLLNGEKHWVPCTVRVTWPLSAGSGAAWRAPSSTSPAG